MANRSKPILVEDDCAPDALQTFNQSFIKETGLCLGDFKKISKELNGFTSGYTMTWVYKGYKLECSADDPYYRLFNDNNGKEVENE